MEQQGDVDNAIDTWKSGLNIIKYDATYRTTVPVETRLNKEIDSLASIFRASKVREANRS